MLNRVLNRANRPWVACSPVLLALTARVWQLIGLYKGLHSAIDSPPLGYVCCDCLLRVSMDCICLGRMAAKAGGTSHESRSATSRTAVSMCPHGACVDDALCALVLRILVLCALMLCALVLCALVLCASGISSERA